MRKQAARIGWPAGKSIADVARRQRAAAVIGRDRELEWLDSLLAPDGAVVAHLHGPAGVGKTALLTRFQNALAGRGIPCLWIEGGAVEPQPAALSRAIRSALARGRRLNRADGAVTVIVIDDFDALRVVQTWLRRVLVPALPADVRIVLAGRSPPPAGWSSDFADLFLSLALGPLSRQDVLAWAADSGLSDRDIERVWSVSFGHPLDVRLAVDAARRGILGAVGQPDPLVETMLAFVHPRVVQVVEAAAMVRRANHRLIDAILGARLPLESYRRFVTLPFVRVDSEGHAIAEPVRLAIVRRLAAADPDGYAALRRAAIAWFLERLHDAGPRERWRYMADLLHFVEEREVRDAFFPPDGASPAVEPADAADCHDAVAMTRTQRGERDAEIIAVWAGRLSRRFHVARGNFGAISAFYICARRSDPLDALTVVDPLLASWLAHLRANPVEGEVLFIRELLAMRENSSARTACMLDLKRAYFERWDLSRVYTVATEETLLSPVMRRLGFTPLSEPRAKLPGAMVLDLPSGGLVGWIASLLNVASPQPPQAPLPASPPGPVARGEDPGKDPGKDLVFVRDRREVTIGARPVRLTRLEAALLAALIDAAPRVVSRDALIETVWRRAFVGSNVVDAVVRTLRRKLGPEGRRISAVPKAGYRYMG